MDFIGNYEKKPWVKFVVWLVINTLVAAAIYHSISLYPPENDVDFAMRIGLWFGIFIPSTFLLI